MRRAHLLLVPLLGIAVLAAVVALVGAREDPGTPFQRLAAEPLRFLGDEVRVTGRIVAPLARDELYVLENATGQQLLLLPPDEAQLAIGVRVSVRGRVELLITDVAARVGTTTLVRARSLTARSG